MTNAQQLDKGALRTSVRINESKKQLPNDTSAFPDEIAHLEDARFKLDDAIKQANDSVEQIDKEYMASKRYMVQYRGEIDPHEMQIV